MPTARKEHNHTGTETTTEVENNTPTSEGPKPKQGTTAKHDRSENRSNSLVRKSRKHYLYRNR
ncbi:hypothetical protein Taro_009945 [Colocasia esculenta]|uniref:Uncharacterized protein n=1 Tax=Colocasia esculenta TaxID=4460 RepID=A0A843U2B2_COLES|nr:hypothetical protein [Colocasia esculenta]